MSNKKLRYGRIRRVESQRGNPQRRNGTKGMEYREEAIWGNPYLRILRSQLEQYIVEKLGADCLSSNKNRTELRKIKKEMADLKKRAQLLNTGKALLGKKVRKYYHGNRS